MPDSNKKEQITDTHKNMADIMLNKRSHIQKNPWGSSLVARGWGSGFHCWAIPDQGTGILQAAWHAQILIYKYIGLAKKFIQVFL